MLVKTRVPNNLDFEQIAQEFPYRDLPTKQRSGEFLYFICGTLTKLKGKRGEYDKKRKGFTPMCAKLLRGIHGEYDLFIKYLIKSRVLEVDGKFKKGEKCTGYKFAKAYRKRPFKEIEITDFRLRKAILRIRQKQLAFRKRNIKGCRHILKWYLGYELEIDGNGAREWVNDFYEDSLLYLDEQDLSEDELDEEQDNLWNKCNSMLYFIEQIENKGYDEWEFSVDPKGRRLHGMFTFNKKELRFFTTYKGKKLVSVDIKNSQPYFSILLLEPEFWQSRRVKTKKLQLIDIAPEIYKIFREDGTANTIIMMLQSSNSITQLDVSTGRYKNLVVTGEIYEELVAEMMGKVSSGFRKKHGHRIKDRKAMKGETLHMMYSRNEVTDTPYYETKQVFRSLFPQVTRVFEAIRHSNYRYLAWILQRVESYLVLRGIAKRIAQERPDIPLWTIHDSIVTTDGNQQFVKEITEQVLTERIGIAPQVQLEKWEPKNAYPIDLNKNYICQNELEDEEIESLLNIV